MAGEGADNGSQGNAGADHGASGGNTGTQPAGAGASQALYDAPFDVSAHIPEALRTEPYFTSFKGKTLGDVIKSGVEAHKAVGGSVRIPGPDAKPEDVQAFYAKTRGVDAPEKYTVKLRDETLAKTYEGKLSEFKKVFFEKGVNNDVAQALVNMYEDTVLADAKNFAESIRQDKIKGELTLKAQHKEHFEKASSMAHRAAKRFGGDAMVQLIQDYHLDADPTFFNTFYAIAQAIHEDAWVNGKTETSMLTREQAKSRVDEILSDKNSPYHNATHPNHGAVAEQVRQYRKVAYAEN